MITGIKFDEWGKTYNFDSDEMELEVSDKVVVETEEGLAFGTVRTAPSEQPHQKPGGNLKKVIRKVSEEDLMQQARNQEKANDAFKACYSRIEETGLDMKLINVEYLFDGSKAIFYYSAEERVDFRELVKDLASKLHTRIEMRQIGVRDEAKRKGGIGPCGRILCCTTWIDHFGPVSVKMAKVQGLSLNPNNISGMCGRLMCCLSYEHKNYVDGTMAKYAEAVKAAAKIEKTQEKEEDVMPLFTRKERPERNEQAREKPPRRQNNQHPSSERQKEQKADPAKEGKKSENQGRKRSRNRRRRKQPNKGN